MLTCYAPSPLVFSCCEQPYTLTVADGVRHCVYAWLLPYIDQATAELRAAEMFGQEARSQQAVCQLQDLVELGRYLADLYDRRVVDGESTEGDLGNDHYWEHWKLACFATYFRCNHSLDLTNLYYQAGFYDPERGAPSFPIGPDVFPLMPASPLSGGGQQLITGLQGVIDGNDGMIVNTP